MKKKLTLILSFALFGAVMLNAQVTQTAKSQQAEPAVEVKQMTAEEKKAIIDKKRENRKARSQANLKRQQKTVSKKEEQMFEALKMDKKQIASYKKIQQANKDGMRKAAMKRNDDPAKFATEIQKVRDTNSAAIKALFTDEQFRQYMDFNESGAAPVQKTMKKAASPTGNK